MLSQVRNNRLVGIVKFEGMIENISIGGEALPIDDLCGTQQPAPIYINSWVVSVEETAPGEITYVWDIEALNVQDSDFRIIRSSNLTNFLNYFGNFPTVTSHGLGTNLYRMTKTEPIDQARNFYRVRLNAF